MSITDDQLERLFALAAAEIDVPEGAQSRVLLAADDGPAPGVIDAVPRLHRPTRARSEHRAQLAAAVVVLLLVAGVVTLATRQGGGSTSSTSSAGAVEMGAPAQAAPPGSSTLPQAGAGAGATSTEGVTSGTDLQSRPGTASRGVPAPAAAPAPADGAQIVRTGSATLVPGKSGVPAALDAVRGLAQADGGYVAKDASTGSTFGVVTLRVPSDRFEALLPQLRRRGRLDALDTQAQDVTGSATDLAARIASLERARSTYLTILSTAKTVQETLSVQQRIDDLQTQLEQLQAQQKVLADSVAYASITVTVQEQAVTSPPVPVHHRSAVAQAWHDTAGRFTAGLRGLLGLAGPVALGLLVLGVAYPVGRLVRRQLRRARV